MPFIIILVIIAAVLVFGTAPTKTIERGPKDAEGCASLVLWIIGAALFMTALVALVGGRVH